MHALKTFAQWVGRTVVQVFTFGGGTTDAPTGNRLPDDHFRPGPEEYRP